MTSVPARLTDLSTDDTAAHPIQDSETHAQWETRLREAMKRHDVPETEFERFRLE